MFFINIEICNMKFKSLKTYKIGMLYIIAYLYRTTDNDVLLDQSLYFVMIYFCLNLQIKNVVILTNRHVFQKSILFDISKHIVI